MARVVADLSDCTARAVSTILRDSMRDLAGRYAVEVLHQCVTGTGFSPVNFDLLALGVQGFFQHEAAKKADQISGINPLVGELALA
mgnify:CR=1 FL=1